MSQQDNHWSQESLLFNNGDFEELIRLDTEEVGYVFSEQGIQECLFEDIKISQSLSQTVLSDVLLGVPIQVPPDDKTSMCQTGSNPRFDEFGGEYNFNISIQGVSRKDLCYSPLLKKVYCMISTKFPVDFSMDFAKASRRNLTVRSLMVYAKDDSIAEPVQRCLNHRIMGKLTDELVLHVLRSADNTDAEYEEDPKSGRFSVVVPVQLPQPGCDNIKEMYQSMCSHSCTCGINRRETRIIFTLEESGRVVGRRVLPIRICCCPKRDMDKEEAKANDSSEVSSTNPPLKRKKESKLGNESKYKKKKLEEWSSTSGEEDDDNDTYTFTITVKGRQNLQKVIDAFDLGAAEVNVQKNCE